MKKILFITEKLQNYRIPILNIIAQQDNIELSVAYSGEHSLLNNLFKEIKVKENKILKFTLHQQNFSSFCSQYDVVISMFYLQKLSLVNLAFLRNKTFKLIYWGIGVKASYNSKYDTPTVLNRIRFLLAKKADAMIFYSNYPVKKYIRKNINEEKLFVANNTVAVLDLKDKTTPKESIIFIGTLYKQKNIFLLLEAYQQSFSKNKKIPNLEIVGDGPDFEIIKNWIIEKNLNHKIILHGSIYNEDELEKLFSKSIVCISPGQAGLSVLKSMGYGVPFITKKEAITGGEIFNIENNVNGVIYNSDDELESIISDISSNLQKYLKMGKKAKHFYDAFRKPDDMAQGIIDAINFVCN